MKITFCLPNDTFRFLTKTGMVNRRRHAIQKAKDKQFNVEGKGIL